MDIGDGVLSAVQIFVSIGFLGALGLVAISLAVALIPLVLRRSVAWRSVWVVFPWLINLGLQGLLIVAVALVVVQQTGVGFFAAVGDVGEAGGVAAGVVLLVHAVIVAAPAMIDALRRRAELNHSQA